MERELRKKFILISVSVVFVVLALIATVINVFSFLQIDATASEIIDVLVKNGGQFPNVFESLQPHLTQETPYSTRYFIVCVDEEERVVYTDTHSHLIGEEGAMQCALAVMQSGKETGFYEVYKYQISETDDGALIVFIDCEQDLLSFRSFLISSIAICFIALIAVFLLILLLSKRAVEPIAQSYRKQQQFITNITHELKTPLSIIKTNTEVIEVENGTSQWSESVHNQIGRLNELINYLISLSKLEEINPKLCKVDFSITDAALETAQGFEVLAAAKDMTIHTHILPNTSYCGDEQSVRLLLSILIENAIKYGTEGTAIEIALRPHKNKMQLEIANSADGLSVSNYDMLFDRFYRMENSRNQQTGGFGIGLAMAKTIVKNHGGDIKAESADGKTLCIKALL